MAYDVIALSLSARTSTILIVGADACERGRFAGIFGSDGFRTLEADGPEAAAPLIGAHPVDLVVLDERSCGARAYSFCRASAVEGGAPVILLSGKSDTVSQIVALEVGADEIFAADVDDRLLLARARAVLRRSRRSGAEPCRGPGRWSLDPLTQIATGPGGDRAELARHQVRLMQIFLDRPGAVVTAELIAREDPSLQMEPAAFRTAISRLRRRLAPLDRNDFIRIVRGCGYVHMPPQMHLTDANWTLDGHVDNPHANG